jgi:hypothetical protein
MEDKMSTIKYLGSRIAACKLCHIFASWALLAGVAYGQVQQTQPGKQVYGPDKTRVPEALAKVKSGAFSGVDVDLLARAGAVEAIPDLEKQFLRTQDPLDKAKIAQGLVKLGDKDDTYWNYLVQLATPAVDSDAPDFMGIDAQGKSVPGPSPGFIAWAKSHSLDPNAAGEDSLYILPGKVGLLGLTGDRRAIPLLRQALLSPNHLIEIAAADGLAEIQDKDSIQLIIAACQTAPAEAATAMARSLVYFDDAEAQSAVDTYLPKDYAKALREARAEGRKTPSY